MEIGIPAERKQQEFRVAMVPAGVAALTGDGHRVWVERGAGRESGFADEEYGAAGAELVEGPAAVFARAQLILKVKEPLPAEWPLLREGQILFTYLHLAADEALTRALLERRTVGVAYETVQGAGGDLPLLTPMSEIAGRMAPQVGVRFLTKHKGGRGILLAGVPGVPPGDVVVLGGGVVGTHAARIAMGLGASVTIIDIQPRRLRELDDLFAGRVVTLMSNELNIAAAVQRADLLIGAVLVPGARAPSLVPAGLVAAMKDGAVIVDVAIDQGGCVETADRVTTHDDPVYVRHGVIHYAVGNMPGAVPRTSTLALANATLPYVRRLARGVVEAVGTDPLLAAGVNLVAGAVTHRAVAAAHNLDYRPVAEALAELG